MNKSALRHYFKKERENYVCHHGHQADKFAKNFFQLAEKGDIPLTRESIVALYYPFGSEASPLTIMTDLWQEGIAVALPKMQGDKMHFASYTQRGTLIKNSFNFFEPEARNFITPTLVITPLLAFDNNGHRLGYGKGHYDRALETLSPEKRPYVLGLAYPCQRADALPFEIHDQKMDGALLPESYTIF